jgi:DNA (cytosine-5)-methyltransferase 1
LNDPRNFLVRRFLRVVEDLSPKIVVIENVPQILTHDSGRFGAQVTARLRGLGYLVKPQVLFAPDYGVPQLRRRAIFLAVREDVVKRVGWVPEFPPCPTHYPANASSPPITGLNAAVTVKDAIFDLPPSAEVEEGGKPASKYPSSDTMDRYAATRFSCPEARN